MSNSTETLWNEARERIVKFINTRPGLEAIKRAARAEFDGLIEEFGSVLRGLRHVHQADSR